jgi:branched-chain amino acid transport system permease protein
VVGAFLVVFFLESTRFVIPLLPGLTPVRGAAVRELLISGSLIALLRLRPTGLIPERLPRVPVPDLPEPPAGEPRPAAP